MGLFGIYRMAKSKFVLREPKKRFAIFAVRYEKILDALQSSGSMGKKELAKSFILLSQSTDLLL